MRAEYDAVGARNALPQGPDHPSVLARKGIPPRVRKINGVGTRGDGRSHSRRQKLQIAAPPLAFRRTREPRIDHVHPERVQLSSKTQLLLGRHRIAGRLLAVAQGGVEDDDVSPHEWLPCSPSRVDDEKKAADLLGSAALTASFLYR